MITNLLKNFPICNFSILPSPIHRLENLSKSYGANIYCMRDDLTGFAFGGNKTRKLDFLIADAIQQKADTLIAVGANQSNFCRLTAAAGRVKGFEVHLLLSGENAVTPSANLLLDHLFEAKIHHTTSTDNKLVENESKLLETELLRKGKKVYRLPMGGSTKIGVLGYLRAFNEILEYSVQNNITFQHIILASGSGGTQAGLVLGQMVTKWPGTITGISVGRKESELKSVINELVRNTSNLLLTNYQHNGIFVNDNYIGAAYGIATADGNSAISEFALLEGILLDRVYTGKAAAGMLDFVKKGKISSNENILFIHTGGNVELFE